MIPFFSHCVILWTSCPYERCSSTKNYDMKSRFDDATLMCHSKDYDLYSPAEHIRKAVMLRSIVMSVLEIIFLSSPY